MEKGTLLRQPIRGLVGELMSERTNRPKDE